MQAFNPSTKEGSRGRISEFKASLIHRVCSRTARATEKPFLEKQILNKLHTVGQAFNPGTKETESSGLHRVGQHYKQKRMKRNGLAWWHIPLSPTLRRQKQADLLS